MQSSIVEHSISAKAADIAWPARLPKSVSPSEYDLDIHIDPDTDTFSASLKISGEVLEPVSSLYMHAVNLTFQEVSVNGERVAIDRVAVDDPTGKILIPLAQTASAGPIEIFFRYSGAFNRQMEGLYVSKSSYKGKEERYAFTKFEPTHARKMLPCFDEPDFKAVFKVTVTAPSPLTVLSNMPALPKLERKNEDGTRTISFAPTPKMSTYLLAIAVARLVAKKRRIAGVEVGAWARPDEINQTTYALDVAEMALPWLNRYFGLKYQLPKLDLVAVPDFASGAMENWGMITFRDVAMLVDPKMTSTHAKRYVAVVVTHEIVHQWFGNLVTMKWWNDLWLNEAFAEWLSHKIVAEWKPRWNLWLEFEQTKHIPLRIDSLDHTRAIVADATTEADIKSMFDSLTYEKGGAVLRMIEQYLGESKFRTGIQRYIKEHRFENTEAADLWSALETSSHEPVSRMAKDWLTQPGYPLVTASLSEDRSRLVLSQNRFSAHGNKNLPGQWTIPMVIQYRLDGESRRRMHHFVFNEPNTAVELPDRKHILWAYPNMGETGFYRIALSSGILVSLLKDLNSSEPAERIGLLNHLWARAQNGDSSIESFLDAVTALKRDPTRVVVEDIAGYLLILRDRILRQDRDLAFLRPFIAEQLDAHWKRLGWGKPRDNDEMKLSRASVLYALASVTKPKTLMTQVHRKVDHYLNNPLSVDPALVSPLLALAAQDGDAELFDAYRKRLLNPATPEQRDQLLKGLAKFENAQLTARLLVLTLTDDIRGQDVWKPLIYALANPATQGQAWEFVRSNWQALRKKAGDRGADRIIGATSALWSEEWRGQVNSFFTDPANEVKMSRRTLEQALESIELGIRFRSAQREPLLRWLKTRYPEKIR